MHKLTPAGGRIEIVGGEHSGPWPNRERRRCLSGHFSNWEVMAAVIVHLGVKCQVTYRAANNPYIDKRIIDTRKSYGVTLDGAQGRDGFARGAGVRWRRARRCLLNDQKFNQGIAAPFFGVSVTTAPGPTRLP